MRPVLWGGLAIGTSRREVENAFPEAAARGEAALVIGTEMFDCDFEVVVLFDEIGLGTVDVHLVRTLVSQSFSDLRQRLIDALRVKHGSGQARQAHGTAFRKRWREPWMEIDFVAVDDPDMPTITISYRKISITDAALRYL